MAVLVVIIQTSFLLKGQYMWYTTYSLVNCCPMSQSLQDTLHWLWAVTGYASVWLVTVMATGSSMTSSDVSGAVGINRSEWPNNFLHYNYSQK